MLHFEATTLNMKDASMPVFAVANPKSGAGKSTSTLVLATTLARQGASVTVLDCDRGQPIAGWRAGRLKTLSSLIAPSTRKASRKSLIIKVTGDLNG